MEKRSDIIHHAGLTPRKSENFPRCICAESLRDRIVSLQLETLYGGFTSNTASHQRAQKEGERRLAAPVWSRPREGALIGQKNILGHHLENVHGRTLRDITVNRRGIPVPVILVESFGTLKALVNDGELGNFLHCFHAQFRAYSAYAN